MNNTTKKRFITPKQLSRETGIDYAVIRKEMEKGALLSYKFGARYRIDYRDAEAWIRECKVNTVSV